jgi:hypothetical protein
MLIDINRVNSFPLGTAGAKLDDLVKGRLKFLVAAEFIVKGLYPTGLAALGPLKNGQPRDVLGAGLCLGEKECEIDK